MHTLYETMNGSRPAPHTHLSPPRHVPRGTRPPRPGPREPPPRPSRPTVLIVLIVLVVLVAVVRPVHGRQGGCPPASWPSPAPPSRRDLQRRPSPWTRSNPPPPRSGSSDGAPVRGAEVRRRRPRRDPGCPPRRARPAGEGGGGVDGRAPSRPRRRGC